MTLESTTRGDLRCNASRACIRSLMKRANLETPGKHLGVYGDEKVAAKETWQPMTCLKSDFGRIYTT